MKIFRYFIKFIKYYKIIRRNNWNYQILFSCDIFIPKLPPSTKISHPVGIVISDNAIIGNNCKILQNVTIGHKNGKSPRIGNNVYFGAGSMVIGGISIGDNVIIGAGAIVLKDVPSNSVVYNSINTIIKLKES